MNTKAIVITVLAVVVAAVLIFFIARMCRRTIPKGVTAVENFDAARYLGKWYEIARFDYKWEKDLINVTATYSMNPDGTIRVENKGYNTVKNEWRSDTGKAKFVESPDVGMLKVSFFGPFYAGYNVIDVCPMYRYALVFGRNTDYIWLLSREKTMPDLFKERYLAKAREAGYDLSKLVWTVQE